jgi:Domain of unknown function (DUF4142)
MVADHQKTSSELKSLVDGGRVKATLPRALDSEHQGMLDELKGKSGKDFDQSYDQTQVKAHQDAVVLFEAYSRAGDDAEPKRRAAKTLPNLKQHLTMAQKLKQAAKSFSTLQLVAVLGRGDCSPCANREIACGQESTKDEEGKQAGETKGKGAGFHKAATVVWLR